MHRAGGLRAAADADLAAALHGELRSAVERYETLKQRAGVLDFVDLLVRARDLIRDSPTVRAEFQRRFTHIFVDEFQDTDPLQAEILLLLAADDLADCDWRAIRPVPGKLFIVGDPKQSIYRFRRADVGIYLEVKDLLAQRGAECVHLRTSFRAVPAIQRFVNAAFAPHLRADRDALQADYVPLDPYRDRRRRAAAGDRAARAAPLRRHAPHHQGRHRAVPARRRRGVSRLAAVVQRLDGHRARATRRARPDRSRATSACCSAASTASSPATSPAATSARSRRAAIPHLLVGGRSFHGREEVETMRAALTAIEWPDDELSVFATLRGSLFAIGDEELFLYRHAHRRLHPFRIADDLPAAQAPIGEALRLLAALHRGRNRRPVADTIALLLEATRAHAGFALRPSGEQALANVLHLAELARTYESSGGMSFRGFVERLLDDADGGQAAEAPILEEGSDGVRIMTVHKAKGLEFPVVVLADITAGLTGSASRYVDPARRLCALRIAGWAPAELTEHEAEEARRDDAEGLRVAYVAATRARDLLVVPAVGDERFDSGWVSCLNGALYPAAGQWRQANPAPGCPAFGAESVLERPAELAFTVEGVRPGLHASAGGTTSSGGIRASCTSTRSRSSASASRNCSARRPTERSSRAICSASPPGRPRATPRSPPARSRARRWPPRPLRRCAARWTRRRRSTSSSCRAPPRGLPARASARSSTPSSPSSRSRPGATPSNARPPSRPACSVPPPTRPPPPSTPSLPRSPIRYCSAPAPPPRCRRETPLTLRAADGTLVEGVVDLAYLDRRHLDGHRLQDRPGAGPHPRRLPPPGRAVRPSHRRRDRRAGARRPPARVIAAGPPT